MYLLIDTSEYNVVLLTLFGGVTNISKTFEARNKQLLQCIDLFLTEQGNTQADIKGIAVVVGKGSFSSTRVAVTVANAWGYAAGIPIVGIKIEETKNLNVVAEKLADQPSGIYVSATYSAEPDIGTPKKQLLV